MHSQPLSEQLRPESLDEVIGQDHLLGNEGIISRTIASGHPLSLILWGPPGCGKTSIARLYAKAFSLPFKSLSAVFSGVADLKKLVKETEDSPLLCQRVVLFVDEIHRFNKAQQDAFLPYVEKGTFILIGATAENPSFYLNNALLSRVRVLQLNALQETSLKKLLERYESKRRPLNLSDDGKQRLLEAAQGDGRYLLNLIENLETLPQDESIDLKKLEGFLQKRSALYDKEGDAHYNLISALHKAIRGSDPDAALYWFARMLEGGEDPLFLARRLIRMATEDIGLADPQALVHALAAREQYTILGSPEGELALAQVVLYLSLAPKSNAAYTAFGKARAAAAKTSHLPPPAHSLNAPTKTMKELGYGKGYVYDHDTEKGFAGQNYFPNEMERETYYTPVARGFEREMAKRLAYFSSLRESSSS